MGLTIHAILRGCMNCLYFQLYSLSTSCVLIYHLQPFECLVNHTGIQERITWFNPAQKTNKIGKYLLIIAIISGGRWITLDTCSILVLQIQVQVPTMYVQINLGLLVERSGLVHWRRRQSCCWHHKSQCRESITLKCDIMNLISRVEAASNKQTN